MRKTVSHWTLLLAFCTLGAAAQTAKDERPIFELRMYTWHTPEQGGMLDGYLERCLIPGLHRAGAADIGVFESIANDTAAVKRTWVLLTYPTLRRKMDTDARLYADPAFLEASRPFMDTVRSRQCYDRIETTLMRAFRLFPKLRKPALKSPYADRVYELRSYESPNEALHRNKVEMFNEGGEIPLFDRLGFNAVFYGEVLAGAHMPNLVYMTSFENRADRDAHWQAFRDDAEWKRLSAMPKYQRNVSRNEMHFLRPKPYSDY